MNNIGNFAEFDYEIKAILNPHAPIKQSTLCGNIKPHINIIIKLLWKETMKISRLKNEANKSDKGSTTFNETRSVN